MPTLDKKFADIDGLRIAYLERGHGDPIVFLHGNPTSSYLWRDVIPAVAGLGRCLAPDLIGMGDSDKLPDSGPESYTFVHHRRYLDAWLQAVAATDRVILIVHDWGSALGLDWARRHPQAVRGIAYLEALVRPVAWSDFPPEFADVVKALRSPAGEHLILHDNMFVEALLPGAVLTPLPPPVHQEYRRPFATPGESRRPTLTWARQIPIDGDPADVTAIVADYSQWMAENSIPKLFINADPGATLVGASRELCRAWPNQTEITVPGIHLIQEDSAGPIGRALADWIRAHVPDR